MRRIGAGLCCHNGDDYHAALCDLDQTEIYLELNLTEEAARMARAAEQQFAKLGMSYEAGRSVVNLAIATHRQNDSARTLELFAQAKEVFTRENNHAWLAMVDLYEALVLFETGKFDSAQRLCSQALKFFEENKLDRRAILCHLLLARLALDTGSAEQAQWLCDTVLRKLEHLDTPPLKYRAYLLLGHVQRNSGAWHLAYKSYKHARLQLETVRGSLQGEEIKIAFLKNKLDVYESLVQVCLRKRSKRAAEEAFSYMEQAKSRTLAELLSGPAAPAWPGADGPAGERIKSLRGELNWYYHRLEIEQAGREDISVERVRKLRAEASRGEDELLHAIRELPRGSETHNVLKNAGIMTVEQIRAALSAEETLLEYFQIGPRFVAAVMTREDLKIVPLADASRVTVCLHMLQFQLSKFRLKSSYGRTFNAELLATVEDRLQQLYRDLVEPLAPELKRRHLVVVPHGVLHYLPFHALSDGGECLIDRFTLSFAPSASIYAACQGKPATSNEGSLLLGVHAKNTPWIEREIRSIGAIVPKPSVFLGRWATKDVLQSAGPASRLIHIATHGFFRRDNPMFSSIRLADGYLTLYDLYQLSLPVDLLTLSGCGTGLNVVVAGDELLGLARGLLCAGAHSLLLSLWDVHDHTTAEFMLLFYTYLQGERDKSVALRSAMLELRKRHPHPYYWAPFVLMGKAFGSEINSA